jgi:hypothetical protein
MPIDLPNLDDREFSDLVEEGKRLIPGFAPSWTDHNVSDPGITFVELFASVAETLMYRVNRISEPNKRAFIQLLAPDRVATPGWTVDQELSAAIRELRIEERAVTAADFEHLCLQVRYPAHIGPAVARAHCLPRCNLEVSAAEALGHLSIVTLGSPGTDVASVLAAVKADLEQRSMLTTKLHVVAPALLRVAVDLSVWTDADQLKQIVQRRVLAALTDFFDPFSGGPDGQGWPFGAPIYRSDLYALLDQVEGVDYIELRSGTDDVFAVDVTGRRLTAGAHWVGVRLDPNELVAFAPERSTIDCQTSQPNVPT